MEGKGKRKKQWVMARLLVTLRSLVVVPIKPPHSHPHPHPQPQLPLPSLPHSQPLLPPIPAQPSSHLSLSLALTITPSLKPDLKRAL